MRDRDAVLNSGKVALSLTLARGEFFRAASHLALAAHKSDSLITKPSEPQREARSNPPDNTFLQPDFRGEFSRFRDELPPGDSRK